MSGADVLGGADGEASPREAVHAPAPRRRAASRGLGLTRAQTQAQFRQRQKEKLDALERQATDLTRRLEQLRLERLRTQAERDTLSERMQLLQQQFHSEGLQQTSSVARQDLHDIGDAEAALMASTAAIIRGHGAPGTTAADWKAITVEQFAGFIQGATDHYQVLLDQGAAVPASPAEARLTRLIHDSGEAIYGVWRYDMPLYMGAMAEMMRRRGAPLADVPKDLAQRQLDVLQLTPEQQQAMVAQYESMLARLKAISAMPEAQLATAEEDDRPASRNFRGLQVIRLAQVAHEAKGKAKIAAMQECYSTCFLRIMTPIQVANVVIASLPHVVDTTFVAALLAAQHSQQERARAQVKAEEATAAWRSVFAADESQQQQATSSDQAGASSSCEPSLLDLGVDLDDPLQGMRGADEDLSWLWDDPDLEPDLFDDPLTGSAAVADLR